MPLILTIGMKIGVQSVPIGGIVTCINNLPIVKIDPEDVLYVHKDDYNCWGFTAAILGWIDSLFWLDCDLMENYLNRKTSVIAEPTIGDIVVFRDTWKELTHTAMLISEVRGLPEELIEVVHKPGNWEIETSSIRSIYERLALYGEVYEYRRVTSLLSIPT